MTAIATINPEATTEARHVWRIDGDQLAATQAKIKKINARAAKRGLGGRLTLDVTEVQVTDTDPYTTFITTYTAYDVVIGGDAPRHNGWEFIATLDWDGFAGLIVNAAPGAATVIRDGLAEGWCGHCKKIRDRRKTYVVRNVETGEQIQVGASCIKDFTGWVGRISFLDTPSPDDEDGFGWFGTAGERNYTPLTVLSYAWACIKLYGFTRSHDGGSTRDMVQAALDPGTDRKRIEFARKLAPLAAEATSRATEILAWILSDEFTGSGDYVHNMKAVAAGQLVSYRNIGLLVSAPQAHAKHMEQTLIRERERVTSEWVGTVGKRQEFTVTVTMIRFIPGYYGTTVMYGLVDEDGNRIKWFASGDKLGETQGAKFRIKATVKEHRAYLDTKETVITRAVVLEEITA